MYYVKYIVLFFINEEKHMFPSNPFLEGFFCKYIMCFLSETCKWLGLCLISLITVNIACKQSQFFC